MPPPTIARPAATADVPLTISQPDIRISRQSVDRCRSPLNPTEPAAILSEVKRIAILLAMTLFVSGCGSSGRFTRPIKHRPAPLSPGQFSARVGWSPTVPRDASTPGEIVKALVARDGLGKT